MVEVTQSTVESEAKFYHGLLFYVKNKTFSKL